MPAFSLAHEDVAIAAKVQTLAVMRQCRALLYAACVDGLSEILRRRPARSRPPRVGDVHVLSAECRLLTSPRRAVGAEDHLKEVQRADTTSEQAFEQYLNGRYFYNRRGESDVLRARSYFQKALQMDSIYARAWAGLAGTYHAALGSGPSPDTQLEQAWLKAIEQALSLGPGIAEVHVRAAQYYWWLGDWRRSDEHCKLAIALNPSDALVLSVSASKALVMGHLHEAVALQRRAVAVDPLSAAARQNLGAYLGPQAN